MAKEINETKDVRTIRPVSFNRRSVISTTIISGASETKLLATYRDRSTEHEEEAKGVAEVIIARSGVPGSSDITPLTVRQALEELEAFTGEPANLADLTVVDLLNSIVHERI